MSNITIRSAFPGFEGFPTNSLSLFEDALNRLFQEPAMARPWSPAVDISENENELLLSADIPGVKMEDIDIKIEHGTLTLSGHREFKKQDEKGGYHRIERGYGSFQRAFSLPETIDAEKVSAAFDNGVLTVTMPKKEMAKPRSIRVAPRHS